MAKIICSKCGWSKYVVRSKAAGEILYHRDVTCPERLQPPEEPPSSRGSMASRTPKQRIKPRKKRYCPTCRDEMILVNRAWKCFAGCTNLAIR